MVVIIIIYTFNDAIKRQRILIRYHNILKHVDNIINTYTVHVIQFNIQDIKCTALLTYKWKTIFTTQQQDSFFPFFMYIPSIRALRIYIF